MEHAATPESGPTTRRITLATCCAIHAVQDGLISTMYVLLPLLAQTFGLGYAQAGAIRALHVSAMSLLELPSGILAERTGERSLLVFGLALAGFGYLCLSISAALPGVALSLFLAGAGAGFQHALSSSVISKSFAGSAPRGALGTYNSAGDVGKLAFTGVFSLAVGAGAAWQQVVAGYGMLAATGAAVVLLLLGRLRVGGPAPGTASTHGAGGGWGIREPRAFAALMLIVFLDIGVQTGFLTFLAFLMIEKQVSAGLAALAVVLTLGGGILGKFGCGFLADRLGVCRSLIIVEVATAIAIAAVTFAPTLLAYCVLPLLGVVLQGSSSITYATVPDLVRTDRHARAFAIVYSVSGLAAIVAPVAFGAIGDGYGLVPAMLVMVAVVLLTVPLTWALRTTTLGAHAR